MYVTVDEVKDYLNLQAEDTGADELIETLIAQVEALVEADKLQRTIGSSTFTDFIDGDGTDTILLKNYPVIEITEIFDDLDRDYDEDSELDPDDMAVYDSGRVVYVDDVFSPGNRNIKVVYRAGYSPVPENLKLAIIKYVAAELLGSRTQVNAIKSDGEGVDIDDRPKRLKKEADEVFKLYRRFSCTG